MTYFESDSEVRALRCTCTAGRASKDDWVGIYICMLRCAPASRRQAKGRLSKSSFEARKGSHLRMTLVSYNAFRSSG